MYKDQVKETEQTSIKQHVDEGLTDCCSSRQSAKSLLKDKIFKLHREADSLQILHDTLPEVLSPEQDDAIWRVANKY